jgi:hypothetical protein
MSFHFWDWARKRIPASRPASSRSPEEDRARAEEILTNGFRTLRSQAAPGPGVDAEALFARIAPRLEAPVAAPVRSYRPRLAFAAAALALGGAFFLARPTAPARVPVDPASLGWVRESRVPQPAVDDPLADSTDKLWSALDRAQTRERKP